MSQNTSPPPYTISYVLPGDNLMHSGRQNPSHPSETDPLVPRKASWRRPACDQYIFTIVVAFLAVTLTSAIFSWVFPLSSCNNPLDPDVRDRIRKEWDVQRHQHEEEVLKRIDIERHWRAEDDERVHLRKQWIQETEEHERNLSETIRRENQEQEARRTEWAREVERHNHYLEERRKRETEEHNREVRERDERERRERLRLNLFWIDLESHTCTTYGTREHTARLVNVPVDYDLRVEACMTTPIQIHGVEYKAKWCEDHGPSNVIGHWEVDQYEPDCAPYWDWYKDWGCVSPGSGERRIEHYLENLPSGADWREFCATTPASFGGMHFIGAQFCFQKNFGTYGHWVIHDERCN